MIRASLYMLACSASNRTRLRLRRLREPRYLLGAAASAAYLYFSVFRFGRPRRLSGEGASMPFAAVSATAPLVAALFLAVAAAVSWTIPFRPALLELSKPELQFLLPAPVSRRQLLVHRLLRSQVGLLFATVVSAVLVPRGAAPARLRFAIAIWIFLVSVRLFLTGIGLARPWLLRGPVGARLAAWAPLTVTTMLALTIGAAVAPIALHSPVSTASAVFSRLDGALQLVPARVALWPFAAMVRPVFADTWTAYAAALPGALAVLVCLGAWVLWFHGTFEDTPALDDLAQEWTRSSPTALRYRVRGDARALRPTGRFEGALVWKAMTEARRHATTPTLLTVIVPGAAVFTGATALGTFPAVVSELLAVLALVAVAFALFLGPQVLRSDLRQELEHLAWLKTWPVPAAATLRGLLAWPVSLLTVIVWALLGAATLLLPFAFPGVPLSWRLAGASAVATVVPGLLALQYVIYTAVTVAFPAWVSSGSQRPRGFDAMGQRLLLLAGTRLALAVLVLPGGLLAFIVWWLLRPAAGAVSLVAAGFLCTVTLLAEAAVAIELLAPAFERLDYTDIERAE